MGQSGFRYFVSSSLLTLIMASQKVVCLFFMRRDGKNQERDQFRKTNRFGSIVIDFDTEQSGAIH